jgi:hypothetical protein
VKFRKKPIVVEARRIPTSDDQEEDIVKYVDDCVELAKWCGGRSYMMHSSPDEPYYPGDPGTDHILIPTLEGDMRGSPGDWIIQGVTGEFYPCKPDVFDQIYEPAED